MAKKKKKMEEVRNYFFKCLFLRYDFHIEDQDGKPQTNRPFLTEAS